MAYGHSAERDFLMLIGVYVVRYRAGAETFSRKIEIKEDKFTDISLPMKRKR